MRLQGGKTCRSDSMGLSALWSTIARRSLAIGLAKSVPLFFQVLSGLRFTQENTHGYRPWQHYSAGQRLQRNCPYPTRSRSLRAAGGRYPGETSSADFPKRPAHQELPIADSACRHPETSCTHDHAICQGTGQHGAGDRFPAAGNRGHRQADVLLLRQRCFLLPAETAARKPQHRLAVWNGKSHLRDPDGARRPCAKATSSTWLRMPSVRAPSGIGRSVWNACARLAP